MQHLAPQELRAGNRTVGVQQRVSVITTIVFPDPDGVWTCQVTSDDNTSWGEDQAQDIAQTRLENEIANHHGLDLGEVDQFITITLVNEERVNSTDPNRPGHTIFTYKEAP